MKVAPDHTDAMNPSSRAGSCPSADSQRNGSNIRKRFLLRLGFETLPPKDLQVASSFPAAKPRFCAASYQQALKTASSGSPGKPSFPKPRTTVSFCSSVTVIPIPSRTDYSDRIRRSLWTSASELHEQVVRNCTEFAAEGWNWKLAVEEPDMIWYGGKRVHPCHFTVAERFSARDHFLHCLAAQQAAQRNERDSLAIGYSY